MRKAIGRLFVAMMILSLTSHFSQAAAYGSMRNGSFDSPRERKPDDPNLLNAKKAGWRLPKDLVWPDHWEPNPATSNGTLEFLPNGGMNGSGAVRIGGGGHISSYFGKPEPGRPYIAAIRLRGKGKIWFGAYHYSEDGFIGPQPAFIERNVDSGNWVEYRGLFLNDRPEVVGINPALSATGTIIIDEVNLIPAEPVDVEMVKEEMALYGTGALIENLEIKAVQVDAGFAARLSEYKRAVEEFRKNKFALKPSLVESIEKKIAELRPYLKAEGKTMVQARRYNDMIVLTRVLKRLAGQKPGEAALLRVKKATASSVAHQKPGERLA